MICEHLNCEPNDLYEWKPNNDTLNTETHALKRLRRDGRASSYNELIRNIPLDRLGEAEAALENLTNSE